MLMLQPCSTIQVLRRIFVDVNKGTQLSNHSHVDRPIAAAQIANSLNYDEVFETFVDRHYALFYTIVPECNVFLVLRLLRLYDSEECRSGSVNHLCDCYCCRRLRLCLPESGFLALLLDLHLDAPVGQPCAREG